MHDALHRDRLNLRMPETLRSAVQQAARRRCQSPAEWCRQGLLRQLAAEGVRVDGSVARQAERASEGPMMGFRKEFEPRRKG
jgi:hypothetical protein